MKALVTGATGFVGWHLVKVLSEHGHTVRAFVRPGSKVEELERFSPEIRRGELAERDVLRQALDGCDAVFHLAGRLRFWEKHPQRVLQANVEGTRHVLAALEGTDCGRLVLMSDECTVGREPDDRPATESTPFNLHHLDDPYIRSKVHAERLVQDVVRRGGLDAVVVNPGLCFGSHDHRPSPGGTLVLRFLAGRLRWRLSGGFFAASVDDVALGALRAWERGETGQRYLLGTRDLPFEEMLRLLSLVSGLPIPRRRLPFRVALLAARFGEVWGRTLLGDPPALSRSMLHRMATIKGLEPEASEKALGIVPTPLSAALEQSVRGLRGRV